MELTSIEKVSWKVFALFGFKRTETISNSLIFVYHLWINSFEEEKNWKILLKNSSNNNCILKHVTENNNFQKEKKKKQEWKFCWQY